MTAERKLIDGILDGTVPAPPCQNVSLAGSRVFDSLAGAHDLAMRLVDEAIAAPPRPTTAELTAEFDAAVAGDGTEPTDHTPRHARHTGRHRA